MSSIGVLVKQSHRSLAAGTGKLSVMMAKRKLDTPLLQAALEDIEAGVASLRDAVEQASDAGDDRAGAG